VLKTVFTAELRKILTYKEELLTDMKNMLYHHTDDVERLQKVIANTQTIVRQLPSADQDAGRRKGATPEGAGGP
jgi:hypothetical protein